MSCGTVRVTLSDTLTSWSIRIGALLSKYHKWLTVFTGPCILSYERPPCFAAPKSRQADTLETRSRITEIPQTLILALTIVLAAGWLAGCASTGKARIYRFTDTYTGGPNKQTETADRIEREATYAVYFKLLRTEECIRVSMSAQKAGQENIFLQEKALPMFFIVEKAIDIRKLAVPGQQFMFSELGRNYDINFKPKQDVEICSDEAYPIKRLDAAVYRIRFSALSGEDFELFTSVFSNASQAVIYADPEQAFK